MTSLRAWLIEPWETPPGGYDPFGADRFNSPRHLFSAVPTRLEYFAAFLGMDTGGYGVMTGGGTYGMEGLDMDQAHVWWSMKAFIDGWLTGTDGADKAWFMEALRAEHARVLALQRRPEHGAEAPVAPEAP